MGNSKASSPVERASNSPVEKELICPDAPRGVCREQGSLSINRENASMSGSLSTSDGMLVYPSSRRSDTPSPRGASFEAPSEVPDMTLPKAARPAHAAPQQPVLEVPPIELSGPPER